MGFCVVCGEIKNPVTEACSGCNKKATWACLSRDISFDYLTLQAALSTKDFGATYENSKFEKIGWNQLEIQHSKAKHCALNPASLVKRA